LRQLFYSEPVSARCRCCCSRRRLCPQWLHEGTRAAPHRPPRGGVGGWVRCCDGGGAGPRQGAGS